MGGVVTVVRPFIDVSLASVVQVLGGLKRGRHAHMQRHKFVFLIIQDFSQNPTDGENDTVEIKIKQTIADGDAIIQTHR